MTETPEVIERYLQLAPEGDIDSLLECFADDAEVIDEEQTFRGRDEIRRWRESIASKFTYTAEVLGTETDGAGSYTVTATLSGNFPGSPVQLQYRFNLSDGLISKLEIAP